jgi:ATP-dependent DNA helicase PIF1
MGPTVCVMPLSAARCPLQVAVTAPTGTAAINIKGSTIHSFGKLGLAKGSKEQLAKEAWRDEYARRRWQDVAVLVIDEGSMVSDELFDKLEYVARCGWGWKEVWQARVL